MMTFFPVPYNDELLYSVLARYHVRSGNVSIKATQKDIYGTDSITAIMDLPSHIYRIMENLPVGHHYTPEYLIANHTLYPFYAAFLPPDHAAKVKESMIGDNGGSIYNRIGLMASSVKFNQYFKFCPQCAEEEMDNLGEMYWHRIHQIPGVLVCPDHNIPLYDSQVTVRGYNKHDYRLAAPETCKKSASESIYTDMIMEKAIKITEDIKFLLSNKVENKSLDWFKEQYLSRLKELSFANVNGRVRKKELLESFLDFYGHGLLEKMQSDINNNNNWLNDMLRRNRRTTHPLRHLLFIQFLGISISDFFSKEIEYKPFGEKPWPCLNPVASHYLSPVVTDIELKHGTDSKSPIGLFRCDCGFIYLRTGPDKEEKDRYKITKIKQFGPVWEAKLKQLTRQRLSLRETARQLKVDPATVKKYAKKLGLQTYWIKRSEEEDRSKNSIKQDSPSKKREGYRREWLKLKKQYPSSSKTELRQLNNSVFTWLYRNDRDWLNRNSPNLKSTANDNHRVDWKYRDEEIYENVRVAVNDLLSVEKPKRITISSVGSRIGIRPLLEKHLDKLPMTKGYLNDKTESIKDFQIRRLQWAVQELKEDGHDLSLWRVYRKAGIRETFQYELQEEALKLIIENNYL
ncbi:TnsD family transposase [Bacillus sp. DTU_2020_1000418_1_SI_GHA_SEK_038]|uniref:TnsD family transposase n=1 Tax=Bacillus sp. DTU_2020_1000418_1_SI_GHA_SEK_038 TaxID=3077585 RepID=UPI0028EE08B8|nr:TnsD family transposase [Bacillus sp. DTU_2020_1000418_1_SI_GHA_SEK_038]WNS75660.1 TnsD family transposase [Bacillus sp. DTU_2020_1000418_1_SI_GHA_SEK_038]